MPFSNYALDTFVAQEISALREPLAKSVASEFPSSALWLQSFMLRSIFTNPLTTEMAALSFALIRRAQGAIDDYDEACAALREFASNRRTNDFFRALKRIESSMALAWPAFEIGNKALGSRTYESGDGSPYERLNLIHNRSKHADPTKLPPDHLHVIWLRDEGIYADGLALQFSEFEDLLRILGRVADRISKADAGSGSLD